MKPVPWSQVRRLLICRTDHLGDLVVSTPALKAFRHHLPEAEIALVVHPAARSLFQGSGWAQHCWSPDQHQSILSFGADLAIGLSPRTSTYRLLQASRARWRVGYCYRERPLSRLYCWWKLSHHWTTSLESHLRRGQKVPHEAEVVARFVEATGLGSVEIRPEVPLEPELVRWGQEFMQGRRLLHLAPRWLEQGWNWPDLMHLLSQLRPLVVTCGPAEEALLPEQLPELEGVEWQRGLDLPRWAALLGGASCLISVDTGAVHIAAARGTPVVVVHLPEHHALCSQQWYPWGVPYRALIKGPPATTIPALQQAAEELVSRSFPPQEKR